MYICPAFFLVQSSERKHRAALEIARRLTRDVPDAYLNSGKVKRGWRIQGGNVPMSIVDEIMSKCEKYS